MKRVQVVNGDITTLAVDAVVNAANRARAWGCTLERRIQKGGAGGLATLKSVMPALQVSEMDRAVGFYTERLGFRIAWRSPGDGDGENWMLESGQVAVLLSTGSHLGDQPRLTGTIYFDTNGVDELWESLRDRVDVVWPVSDMEHGTREFEIRDPDGYLLAFAEQRG